MSEEIPRDDITKRVVVYKIPGMDKVTIRRDAKYQVADDYALTMDLYYPCDSKSEARIPAVVFVLGYSDSGFQRIVGCKQKEMGSYISWGQLAAASGLVAITYTTREPTTDIRALLLHIRQNADRLGIDKDRIGVWACSGNVPMALAVLMQEDRDFLKCAVLCYGIMLDLEGATSVAEASKKWGFVNPSAGKTVDDLSRDIPLFIARAGLDENPHLNETLDRFMASALVCNLPMTFVNHPTAPHAFDVSNDSETSCEVIRQILAFMRFHLLASLKK
jgi:hypothetical protein